MKISACLGFVSGLLLLLAGCSSTPTAPGVYKDYEDLDTVEIAERFHLSAYRRILVVPLDTRSVVMPDNPNTRSSVRGIIEDATKHVAEKLQSKLPHRAHIAVSVAPLNTSLRHNPDALILNTTLVSMDAGSETARIFSAGFGGKTKVTLAGEFIDGGSGRTLLRFSKANTHGQAGPFNLNSRVLEDNEDEIIEAVADLLKEFYP